MGREESILLLKQIEELVQFGFVHASAVVGRRINTDLHFLGEGRSAVDVAAENIGIGLGMLGHGLLRAQGDFAPLQSFQQKHYLTNREAEIKHLLLDGLTPALIAQRLNISIKTVYRHVANIYQKCHISNRQELNRLYYQR